MDYKAAYDRLIEKARNREEPTEYTERHHVIPRSIGGVDDASNIVVLTAREHFLAHLLLAYMYGGPLWHAVHWMSNNSKYQRTTRAYQKAREEHAKQVSIRHTGKVVSEETKRKLSENAERSAKISKTLTGRKHSKEHIEAWKQSRINSGGWIVSDEQKQKVSEKLSGKGNPMWGKTHDAEAIKRIKEANAQKVNCPHCGKNGGIAIMKRWHFENCKTKS